MGDNDRSFAFDIFFYGKGGKIMSSYPLRAVLLFSVLYLLAIIPAADVLPPELAWENGLIENSQAIMLLFGVLLSLHYAGEKEEKGFFYTGAAFLFMLFMRELSFGRVFFLLYVGPDGPHFMPMKEFPFHTEIYIFLGIYFLGLLWAFIRYIPWRRLIASLRRANPTALIPRGFFLITVICALLSTAGDRAWMLEGYEGETMEELAELLMYFSAVNLLVYYRDYFKRGQ